MRGSNERRARRHGLAATTVLLVAAGLTAGTGFAARGAVTGSTTLVSAAPDGTGSAESAGNLIGDLSVSGDGRYVVFGTYAENLSPDDHNQSLDVYLRDLRTATTSLVSAGPDGQAGDGFSFGSTISSSGRFVAFTSSAALLPSDTNGLSDVYVKDLSTGTLEIGATAADGSLLNGSQRTADLSADGRYLLFTSDAAALTGHSNPFSGTYVKDRDTGAVTRMDVASDGTPANNAGGTPYLSPNGRFVGFSSNATNLGATDAELCLRQQPPTFPNQPPVLVASNCLDVFVHDRDPDGDGVLDQGATTAMVSVSNDGEQANSDSGGGSVSNNGDVALWSYASNLGGESRGIYVHTAAGATVPVGTQISNLPVISADGTQVAFDSFADQGTADTNGRADTFVYDRSSGSAERVSVASDGSQLADGGVNPVMSDDGAFVAFISYGPAMLPPGSVDTVFNVFLRDRSGAPANAGPVAQDSARTVPAGETSGLTLSASDSDGDPLSYAITTAPSHGTLAGTAPALTYTPDAGYSGPDLVRWSVSDGKGGSATARISINVAADGSSSVSQQVSAGQTVSTGTQPTAGQPVQAAVTTPVAGNVTITEDASVADPVGYGVLGSQYVIEAPTASVQDPLHLTFAIATSSLPAGANASSVTLFRNGVAIAACADSSGQAVPDPCVADRSQSGGTITITVLSSHASSWTAAVAVRPTALTAAPAVLAVRKGAVKVTVASLSARLTSGGAGLSGQTLRFTTVSGAFLCQAVTGPSGTAACTTSALGAVAVIAGRGYRVAFAGSTFFRSSAAQAGLVKVGR
ncbi:MAG: Ig-like domain-containing protein [Marmoricola sp.]